MKPGEEADIGKNLTVSEVLVNIKSSKESLQQVCLVFDLDLRLGVGVESKLDHAEVITDHGLCPVVDKTGAEEGEMALVMVREVFVEILRGDELQHCVPQELHSLVAAHGQVVEADGSVSEGSGQQSDVFELNPSHFLKLHQFLEDRIGLYPMSVPLRLLSLKRVRRQVLPSLPEIILRPKHCLSKDSVSQVDATIQEDCSHQRLETVCHGVSQLRVMT